MLRKMNAGRPIDTDELSKSILDNVAKCASSYLYKIRVYAAPGPLSAAPGKGSGEKGKS